MLPHFCNGFIVRENRRTTVTQFSKDEIEDLYRIRANLETLAVEKAILNMTHEDIQYLQKLQVKGEEHLRSGDVVGYVEYELQFHSKIRSMSKDRLLAQLIDIIIKKKEDILLIPERLIEFVEDTAFVQVKDSTTAEIQRRVIETGLSDGLNIEVTEGLKEGEILVEKPPKEIT